MQITVSIRQEIDAVVQSIEPYDVVEREHVDAARRWISSGAEIFRIAKPDIPSQHLVSYSVLVDPLARTILLADHRLSGLWLPSGGHVEPNEHPRITARRELHEELGVDADFLRPEPLFLTVTETTGTVARHTDVSLWYIFQADSATSLNVDPGEFHGVRWFAFDDIPFDRADPHMWRFVHKLRCWLAG
jgi:8-oxo-dGTP diphosphatase